jgi:glucan phosphoethanolaminetransferase (alkaline phosphatase superfamily)
MDKVEIKKDGFTIPSLIFLALDIIGCILAAFLWGPIHDKFFAIFRDVKETSSTTYSPLVNVMSAISPTLIIIAFVILIIALIAKEILIKKKITTFIINLVVGIGLIIAFPLFVWTSFASLFELIDKLKK